MIIIALALQMSITCIRGMVFFVLAVGSSGLSMCAFYSNRSDIRRFALSAYHAVANAVNNYLWRRREFL